MVALPTGFGARNRNAFPAAFAGTAAFGFDGEVDGGLRRIGCFRSVILALYLDHGSQQGDI
ncbi:hypothetical protein [Microvirga makkahensis]|uniref:hypothetical protein n=1 Tax=Microvirga makkahensis TaxID=1128670 RepID=UPI001FE885A4|nr:hypothetical protein [Microvirga makkahensis]